MGVILLVVAVPGFGNLFNVKFLIFILPKVAEVSVVIMSDILVYSAKEYRRMNGGAKRMRVSVFSIHTTIGQKTDSK